MKFELNSTLLNIVPEIKLGINHYTRITVSESPQMLQGRLRLFQEQLFFDLDDKLVTDYPEVKEWRELWKQLGADPNENKLSSEALLLRIQKQNYIDTCNTAVDLNNFFSLQHKIPIGIYDLDKINGDIIASLGTDDDGFTGLNDQYNTMINSIQLSDDTSSFASPVVDSKRTAISSRTIDALHVFYIPPSLDVKTSLELTTACGNMFTSMSGGDVRSYLVHQDQTSIILEED